MELARIASEAHGVVTRRELVRVGVTSDEINERLRRGTLLRVHRGVYRVGHLAASLEARYMAAVRAGGEDAVLSGRAGAYLFGIVKGSPPAPEVTTPMKRRVKGIKMRRSRLHRDEMTVWRSIPVTTVPRTLVDLAADHSADELARLCHEAEVRYGPMPARVEAVLARRPNTPGTGTLRAVLLGDVHILLSRLEKRFIAEVRALRRPLPLTNRPAGGHYVDCRWPNHRLTVELDSYRYHRSRYAWEQDRRRERDAYARGDQFRRYTWGDVFEHPEPMLAEVRSLLPEGS